MASFQASDNQASDNQAFNNQAVRNDEILSRHEIPSHDGRLADNILHFARILRRAGLPVGPAHTLCALEAIEHIGIDDKDTFFWALHSLFVSKPEHSPLFETAFHAYWRTYNFSEKLISLMSPQIQDRPAEQPPQVGEARVKAAMTPPNEKPVAEQDDVEVDARLTISERDRLQKKDFEQMTVEEVSHAKHMLQNLQLPSNLMRTRRYRSQKSGRYIDLRRTLRHSIHMGGEHMALAYKEKLFKPRPVVALIDISGSMSVYSRVLLHFMHGLTLRRPAVQTFLFGTRLTNISRELQRKDPDEALLRVSSVVPDWSGGTLIARSLEAFNVTWSRRVLSSKTLFLLFTDGLERDMTDQLDYQMGRLHRSVGRLIWLNPLLRFEGFEPKAQGIQAMLQHVDELRSAHSLHSIQELVQALDERNSQQVVSGGFNIDDWQMDAVARGAGMQRWQEADERSTRSGLDHVTNG